MTGLFEQDVETLGVGAMLEGVGHCDWLWNFRACFLVILWFLPTYAMWPLASISTTRWCLLLQNGLHSLWLKVKINVSASKSLPPRWLVITILEATAIHGSWRMGRQCSLSWRILLFSRTTEFLDHTRYLHTRMETVSLHGITTQAHSLLSGEVFTPHLPSLLPAYMTIILPFHFHVFFFLFKIICQVWADTAFYISKCSHRPLPKRTITVWWGLRAREQEAIYQAS